MILGPPRLTLLPYTTLFQSLRAAAGKSNCNSHLVVLSNELLKLLGSVKGRPAAETRQCSAGRSGAADGLRNVCREHAAKSARSEEHTSELQSRQYLVCRLLI